MWATLVWLALLAAVRATGDPDSLDVIINIINSSNTTWKAGRNIIPSILLNTRRQLGTVRDREYSKRSTVEPTYEGIEIPEEFDARAQWTECSTIPHIQDQGNCLSCWANAAAGSFSDRLCIASKGEFNMPLSVEKVLSCCKNCGNGCNQGFPYLAWEYFAKEGLVTGGDYGSQLGCQPYSIGRCDHANVSTGLRPHCKEKPDETPTCKSDCTNPDYDSADPSTPTVYKAGSYKRGLTVKEAQVSIMTYGPIVASFDMYEDFSVYKSGVYQHVSGDRFMGHVVRVVGWGTENWTPYWHVANSWSSDWGDNGFFKVIRGSNECGFEKYLLAGEAKWPLD